jgi:pilus assembly protein CpaE
MNVADRGGVPVPQKKHGNMQPAWGNEGGHIRLMVVDDVADTADNVTRLLYFEPDIEVVAVANSGQDAINKAIHLVPDIILMDINMRDTDGFRAAEQILQQVPTRIVMMSVQSEPEYFKQAMAVGARDYLVKPFSGDQLIGTLHKVAQIPVQSLAPVAVEPEMRNGHGGRGAVPDRFAPGYGASGQARARQQIIAVFSGKGGVGRSVIALNLAILLRQLTRERVALVDANLQAGDIHILMGVNVTSSIDDLREAAGLDAQIIDQVLGTHESGVRVLRAPLNPESVELFNADEIKRILLDLRENFDYLVVDMSSHYSDVNLTILEMADQIVLVTTMEITSLNKVTRFFEVAEHLGYPEQKIVLVCNRVESYYGIKPQQVQSQVRHPVAAQLPEEVELLVSSVNRGIPMVLYARNHQFTKQLTHLAKQIAGAATVGEPDGRNGHTNGKPKKRGLFGR